MLFVEDDDAVRDLARRVLINLGYSVMEAVMLSELHQGSIDLLLTDVVMPEMSGRQLALKLEPLRPGMRVLYMSGYTDDTLLRYGVQENQVPFLQKPFTADALVAKVKKAISGCS